MHDFKVGDQVRRINSAWCSFQEGDVGTVTALVPGGIKVEHNTAGGAWTMLAENFVHVPPTPVASTRIPSPLPEGSAERKEYPLYSGLLAYFPAALAAVAHHSYKGNKKHNPGLPMQHARGKSSDHADALLRHLTEGDYEGAAWRSLALLQEKLEEEGAPVAPAATFDGAE